MNLKEDQVEPAEWRVNDPRGIHGPMSYDEAVALHRACADSLSPDLRQPYLEYREGGRWLDHEYGDANDECDLTQPVATPGRAGTERRWTVFASHASGGAMLKGPSIEDGTVVVEEAAALARVEKAERFQVDRIEAAQHWEARFRELEGALKQAWDEIPWGSESEVGLSEEIAALVLKLKRAEPILVAADRIHEAYAAMLEGRDPGRLPEWQPAPDTPPTGSNDG